MTEQLAGSGPCRQLLDWLVEQTDILERHAASRADATGNHPESDELLERQLRDARDWLNHQLERALSERGIAA